MWKTNIVILQSHKILGYGIHLKLKFFFPNPYLGLSPGHAFFHFQYTFTFLTVEMEVKKENH